MINSEAGGEREKRGGERRDQNGRLEQKDRKQKKTIVEHDEDEDRK